MVGIFCAGPALADKADPWAYHGKITVVENSGNPLTEYQVPIRLNSSNFDFSKANVDGSDLRFFEGDKSLPYWIEDWDQAGKEALVWVRIPFIPANGETTIEIAYGNPNAMPASNGKDTFDFFDTFDGTTLQALEWNSEKSGEGYVEVKNGTCKLVAPKVHPQDFSMIISRNTFDINSVFVVKRMKVTTGEDVRGPLLNQGFIDRADGSKSRVQLQTELENENRVRWDLASRAKDTLSGDLADVGIPEGNWYESGVAWYVENNTNKVAWFKNGVRVSSMDYGSNDFVPDQPLHVYLYARSDSDASKNTGYMAVDQAFVRKFAGSEPSVRVLADSTLSETSMPEVHGTPTHSINMVSQDGAKENLTLQNKTAGAKAGQPYLLPDNKLEFRGIRLSSPYKYDFSALKNELNSAGIDIIFLSVDPNNIWQYERFVKDMHEKGLKVYAVLLEDPGTVSALGQEGAVEAVKTVLDYNNKSLAGFDGITVYMEPSPDPSSKEDSLDYIALMRAANMETADIEGEARIPFSVSVPLKYDAAKLEELAPLVDFFVLRVYEGETESLNDPVLIEDSLASKLGEVRGAGSKGVIELGVMKGFKDKVAVRDCLSSLSDYYGNDPAFSGFSISAYDNYSSLPLEAKAEAPKSKWDIPGFDFFFAVLAGFGAFSLLKARKG